jgi:hypothetical protein
MAVLEASSQTRIVRWVATVNYLTENGSLDIVHDLEELSDLHDLVERGPHWDTIIDITIVRSDRNFEELTVEKAATL